MNITPFGRVEVDPARVPVAASMRPHGDDPFARTLDDALDADLGGEPESESAEVTSEPARAETLDADSETAAPAPEAPTRPDASATARQLQVQPPRPEAGEQQTRPSNDTRAKRPGGTVPVVSSPTLPARTAGDTATPPPAASETAGATTTPQATSGQQGQPRALTSGSDKSVTAKLDARSPKALGYRTLNRFTMRLAEQARDSVFKQIAMRLTRGGGEMRVRLDPPELGRLDMQVIVEKGGLARLVIQAERPELSAMLDKHMDELKQSLSALGVTVTEAEVRTGGQQDGQRDSDRDGPPASFDDGEEIDETTALPRRRGFVTAEGFDLWV